MSNRIRLLIIGLVGLLVLAGCASPPEPLGNQATALPGQIKTVRDQLDAKKKAYNSQLKDKKYDFMRSYSDKQKRVTLFKDAENKLNAADKVVSDTVNPIAENYDDGKKKQLQDGIAKATRLKNEATQLLDLPLQWADTIVYARAHQKDVVAYAKTQSESLTTDHAALAETVGNTKTAFPKQSKELDKRLAPFTKLESDAAKAFTHLNAENAKATPNYAVMAADAELIANNRGRFTTDAQALTGAIGQLSSSETHTLIDIVVETVMVVERTSWYEGETENPDEHDYEYAPRKVDQETANHFAQFATPGTLLATDGGSFDTASGVDRKFWDRLKIDSLEKRPSDDNSSEFYMGEFDQTICHKLYVIKNGKPDSSGRPDPSKNSCAKYDKQGDIDKGIYWVEADDFRGADMGMDIYSKGAGDFPDQATEQASPPGMAYVGDPNMGHYVDDGHGSMIWAFFAGYMFGDLIGGSRGYYDSDYRQWNDKCRYRDNCSYYSGTASTPLYGGKSKNMPSRLAGSNYYNKKSGLRDTTVRNAGPAARGGGPGGGGK